MSDKEQSYPPANVIEPSAAKPAKLTSMSGWWTFDFGEPVKAEMVADVRILDK